MKKGKRLIKEEHFLLLQTIYLTVRRTIDLSLSFGFELKFTTLQILSLPSK